MKNSAKSSSSLKNKIASSIRHWAIKEEIDNTPISIDNPSINKLIQNRIDAEKLKASRYEIVENIANQEFVGDSQFTTFQNKPSKSSKPSNKSNKSSNEKYAEAAIAEFKKQNALGMQADKEKYINALEMMCTSGVMSVNDFIAVRNGELFNDTAMHKLKGDMSSLNKDSKAAKALGVKEHDIASINKAITQDEIHAFNAVKQNTSQLIEYLNRVIKIGDGMRSEWTTLENRVAYNAHKFIRYAESENFKHVYNTPAKAMLFNAEYPIYLQQLKGSGQIKSDDIVISELHNKATEAIAETYDILNKTREIDRLGTKKFAQSSKNAHNNSNNIHNSHANSRANSNAINHSLLIAELDAQNRYITKQRLSLLQKSWEIDVNFDKILKYTVGIEILKDNLKQMQASPNKGDAQLAQLTQLATETIDQYSHQIDEIRQKNTQIIKDSTAIAQLIDTQSTKQKQRIEEETKKIIESEFVQPATPVKPFASVKQTAPVKPFAPFMQATPTTPTAPVTQVTPVAQAAPAAPVAPNVNGDDAFKEVEQVSFSLCGGKFKLPKGRKSNKINSSDSELGESRESSELGELGATGVLSQAQSSVNQADAGHKFVDRVSGFRQNKQCTHL